MFSSISSVQLACHIFIIFILGFKLLILHKLKNTLKCRLKLNQYNNRSFLVAYSATSK